jgi:hypothetical protein
MTIRINLRQRAELKLTQLDFGLGERSCRKQLILARDKNVLRDGFSVV